MHILFIPVGIPGCGKSSWANGLPDEVNIESTDNVRHKLGFDPASVDPEVFAHYHRWIEDALADGESVYADATNLQDFARADLRALAQKHGARTHLVLFRNLEQAIARNAARDGTTPGVMAVPPDAMIHLIAQYERAILDIASEDYSYVTEVSAVR